MTVNVTKPQINLRDKLSEVDKPSGIAGEAILRSETPQEVFNYIGAGRRNLVINGAMQVAQRGTTGTAGGATLVSLDRYKTWVNGGGNSGGSFTVSQDSDAPDGFNNSLKVTVNTATTIASDGYDLIGHFIEGYNAEGLAWGTASAKTVTLSFWVKSSLAGTFGGVFSNQAQDKSYPYTYTINSVNTWEYKTVVVEGITSGTWLTTNSTGVQLYFDMGSGSTFLGASGSWASATYLGASGTSNITGNLNATWQITGVQLEVGKVATPFEHRSYGEELALCQRYYYKKTFGNNYPALLGGSSDGSNVFFNINFPTTMRANPSSGTSSFSFATNLPTGNFIAIYLGAYKTITSTSFTGSNKESIVFKVTCSGLTAGDSATLDTGSSVFLSFDSEL